MKKQLLKKINERTAQIGIIGLGYVGLPLSVAFAESGFSVLGYDKSITKVETLRHGEFDIVDISSKRLVKLIQNKKLRISNKKESLVAMDILIICVPTPLTKSHEPDVSYIEEAVSDILETWHIGKMVLLESTTYPGTSKEMIHDVLIKEGYKLDEDFMVGYSPERVDPGNKLYHVENTPKVIGGISKGSTEVATAIYETIVQEVVPVSSTEVAEMSKLLENTFRSINIAFINEMALLCEKMGIDVWETIDASSTKPFGFMRFLPGPGIGGHCIPLDPMYLSWKAKEANFFSRFITLSQEINESMPGHTVFKAMEALNKKEKSLNQAKILLVGVAYKENIDDLRESPSLKIIESLEEAGGNVDFCDPLVNTFFDKHGQKRHTIDLDYGLFKKYDLVILVSCHSCFDVVEIAKNSQLILDTKNVLSNQYQDITLRIGDKAELKR